VAPPTWVAAVTVVTTHASRELAVDVEAVGGAAAVDDVVAVGAAAVAGVAEARRRRRDTWFAQEFRWAEWRYMIY
jgi:hypothetical protein